MEQVKKVAFVISNFNHGNGGHFYSFQTITTVAHNFCIPYVILIGKKSPVIDDIDLPKKHIKFNGLNVIGVVYQLSYFLIRNKIEIVHSFDERAFFFSRTVCFIFRKKLVQTKCGGPNKSYYPKAKALILFSRENYQYFLENPKFKESKLYLLPNRVIKKKEDEDNQIVTELRQKICVDSIFIKISRISETYEKSILQSINLIKIINKMSNQRCALVIIGIVEAKPVFNRLIKLTDRDIILLTEPKYTSNASKFISIADFVIATGRGIMEGAMQRKVLLTTINNSRYPTLITKDNIEGLFSTNFSPRNFIEGFNEEANIEQIVKLLNSKSLIEDIKEFNYMFWRENFDIESVLFKYEMLYRDLKISYNINFLDYLKNGKDTIKLFLFETKFVKIKKRKLS